MGAKGTPKGTQREPSGKFRAPSGTISDYFGLFLTILDYFGLVFPQHVKIAGKKVSGKTPNKAQIWHCQIYHHDIS